MPSRLSRWNLQRNRNVQQLRAGLRCMCRTSSAKSASGSYGTLRRWSLHWSRELCNVRAGLQDLSGTTSSGNAPTSAASFLRGQTLRARGILLELWSGLRGMSSASWNTDARNSSSLFGRGEMR